MADIKVRKVDNTTIKKIDRTAMMGNRIKDNIVGIKERTKETYETRESSGQEYATNRTQEQMKKVTNYGINKANNLGKKGLRKTQENFIKRRSAKDVKDTFEKTRKIKQTKKFNKLKKAGKSIKKGGKTIKNTAKAAKTTAKNTQRVARASAKMAKKAVKVAKSTAKAVIKALTKAVKAIIAAAKALISALIAGGWVVVVIVIVVCLIGLICSSVYGIFFSSEDMVGDKTMSSIISEINMDFNNKLTEIQNENPHDEVEITNNRAQWRDIIAIYAVLVTGGEEQSDVITLDDTKIEKLKSIFWEMNEITYEIEQGVMDTDTGIIAITKLHIFINGKKVDEMADKYNFNNKQRKQLKELTKEQYASMWNSVIYGSINSIGSIDIVVVAKSQLGNEGGQPFWSWYGFTERVEWCACFVSWCANQCGYLQNGVIPKFAKCTDGVDWFQTYSRWKAGGYTPKAGDIIFFDWKDKRDGLADHVGIVDRAENGKVYTVEGNSHDACRERDYPIDSTEILGYGIPAY